MPDRLHLIAVPDLKAADGLDPVQPPEMALRWPESSHLDGNGLVIGEVARPHAWAGEGSRSAASVTRTGKATSGTTPHGRLSYQDEARHSASGA